MAIVDWNEKMTARVNPEEIDYFSIINVKALLQEEFPNLSKFIPSFLICYLEKLVHQKELAALLERNKYKFKRDWILGVLQEFEITVKTIGEENTALPGRYIYISNHPLGGLDGMSTLSIISKYHDDFYSLSNQMITIIPNLRSFIIPVNQAGRQSRYFIDKLNGTLQGNAQIITHPGSIVSQKIKGEITDLPWNMAFLKHAIESKRDIIPVFIEARLSNFYYRFARIIRLLGLDINITMLILMDETFKQKGSNYTVIFGKPIPWTVFDSRFSLDEWAQIVRGYVYTLKNNPDADFVV